MSTRSIELRIEDSWITALSAVAGAYPVHHWRDVASAEAYPCFVVHCGPVQGVQSTRGELCECPVSLGAQVYWADDKQRAVIDPMMATIEQLARTLAPAGLSDAAVTVAGLVWGDGAETTDSNVVTRSLPVMTYVQLTGSLTSTTTTSTTT